MLGYQFTVVLAIQNCGEAKLAGIAETLNAVGSFFRPGQRRQQQRGQDRDDCDYNEQLNERETLYHPARVHPGRIISGWLPVSTSPVHPDNDPRRDVKKSRMRRLLVVAAGRDVRRAAPRRRRRYRRFPSLLDKLVRDTLLPAP
jgi:hypothetical protein